jgi:hypothetical protein
MAGHQRNASQNNQGHMPMVSGYGINQAANSTFHGNQYDPNGLKNNQLSKTSVAFAKRVLA